MKWSLAFLVSLMGLALAFSVPALAEMDHITVKINGAMNCAFWAYGVDKSLKRLGGVSKAITDYKTATSQISWKAGVPADFTAIGKAIDNAGFSVGEIWVRATGKLTGIDGSPTFTVSGTNQAFPLAPGEGLNKVKAVKAGEGKEVSLYGKVVMAEGKAALAIEEVQIK